MKKILVITGGSKGIGLAIVQKYLDNDWFVFIGSRSKTSFINKNIKNKNLFYFKMDVTKENDHLLFLKYIRKYFKKINCYINCAGLSNWSPLEKITNEFVDNIFETNFKGTLWGCKSAVKILKKNGSIINISSLAGKRGSKNNSIYSASKFAINGLTQSLSKELGPRGIRVNAVCPVYVVTSGLKKALNNLNSPSKGNNLVSFLNNFLNNNASLKNLPQAKDIADMCYFLSSEDAKIITGQCINLDSGVFPQ